MISQSSCFWIPRSLGAPWWNHRRNSLLQAILHLATKRRRYPLIRQQTSTIWDFQHVPKHSKSSKINAMNSTWMLSNLDVWNSKAMMKHERYSNYSFKPFASSTFFVVLTDRRWRTHLRMPSIGNPNLGGLVPREPHLPQTKQPTNNQTKSKIYT